LDPIFAEPADDEPQRRRARATLFFFLSRILNELNGFGVVVVQQQHKKMRESMKGRKKVRVRDYIDMLTLDARIPAVHISEDDDDEEMNRWKNEKKQKRTREGEKE
jgi:hypothetical protein